MSFHIKAYKGEIAETVLLPGDPVRAKWAAETFLTNYVCYNKIRYELGYTGMWDGKKVSIQSTGMGMPSTSIYVTELIRDYGVKQLIRIGSAGGLQKNLNLGTIVVPEISYTDSAMVLKREPNGNLADKLLVAKIKDNARRMGIDIVSGANFSTDDFWESSIKDMLKKDRNILSVEMESSSIFSICKKYAVAGASLLTISDNLMNDQHMSSEEKEVSFIDMVRLALSLIN